MHGARGLFLASVGGAWALLFGSVSSLLVGSSWTDLGHVVEVSLALVASGFLYFVRRWIAAQEAADRKVMDTIREEIAQREEFQREVIGFMGLVKGHLGLHSPDSDPAMQIRQGERRAHQDRRIIRPEGR